MSKCYAPCQEPELCIRDCAVLCGSVAATLEGVTRLTDTTVEVLGTVALDRTFRWLCAEGVDMGGRPAKIKVSSFD